MGRRRLFEEKDLGEYPSEDEVREEVERWEDFWNEFNKDNQVIGKITELTEVDYPHDIPAFIIGRGLLPMSVPLILPMKLREDDDLRSNKERANLIMHELLHKYAAGMEVVPKVSNYWDEIKEKYSDEPTKTVHHIIIYAFLIKLFEEFLPQEKVEDFVSDNLPNYVRALEIAKEEGPDELIKEFRELTQKE